MSNSAQLKFGFINRSQIPRNSMVLRGRGGKHGDIFWDNESYAIKHYLKMFSELASATLKQVADWFVWLASTLGKFNVNELRRADHEVHDIADGRYDGRIQKYQQGLTR